MFGKRASFLVLQNIVNSLAGLIGMYFLVHHFPVAWEILSFGIAFTGLFTTINDLGFSIANVKLQSQGEDEGACNSTYLLSKLLFNGAYALVTIGALLVWVLVLNRGFQYSEEFWVVIALVPYYIFQSMTRFPSTYFNAKFKPAKYIVPSMVEAVLRNSIFVMLAITSIYHIQGLSDEQTSIVVSLVYVFTNGIYFGTAYILGRPWKFSRPSMRIFRKYMVIGIPLALSSVVSVINGNVDKVIIQFYWNATATGAFFLDQRITVVLTSFSTSIAVFLLPMLSRLHMNGSQKHINASIFEYERILIMISVPVSVIFAVLSLYIVNIFNARETVYYYILTYLSVYAIIFLDSYPFNNALIANGHQKTVAIITAIGLIINIIFNLVTIPQSFFGIRYLSLGVLGGAVSTIIARSFMNISFRVSLYRISRTPFNFRILKFLVPVAVQIVFLKIMLMYVKPYSFVILAPLIIASAIVYTAVVIAIREITLREIMVFLKNLNPLKLVTALKEE